VVFAKGGLIDFCEANRIVHHRFQTFADVLEVVSGWSISAGDHLGAKKLA
jgi:2-hydroxy-3-keto-5-methylthiopentenyl-1-phosphate phosphatase